MSLCPVDEVLHDEEVIGEAHSGDGLELEVELLGHVFPERRAVALLGTLVHQVAQVGHGIIEVGAAVVGLAFLYNGCVFGQMAVDVGHKLRRQLESRQHVAAVDFYRLHLFQHLDRIGQGLRMRGEESRHLVFALEVLLLSIAKTVHVGHVGVGGEADETVVRGAVFAADEVHVVGGDNLHSVAGGQVEDGLGVGLLPLVELFHLGLGLGRQAFDGAAVQHHLQVVVFPEEAFEPLHRLVGVFRSAVDTQQVLGDFAGHAGAAADEPFVVLFQQGVVDSRLVVEAFDVPERHQLHEVVIADIVLCQEDEMVVFTVLRVL